MERATNRAVASGAVGAAGRGGNAARASAKRATGSSAAASRRRVAAAGPGAGRGERASLRERKKQKTWEGIASATVALVVEQGFDAVRIEDVCTRAEVGRSTFFRYFDSKEAAFVAGIHQGRLDSVVEAVMRRPEADDALAAVTNAFLEAYADWREQRDLMRLEAEIRTVSAQVKVRSLGQQVAWESLLARAIEPRLAAGPRQALHARLLAATVVSAVRMANDQWLAGGARRSPAKELTAALEAVRELVGGSVLAARRGRSRTIR